MISLGFDIDGVVLDLVSLIREYFIDQYQVYFNPEDLGRYNFEEITGLPHDKVLQVVNESTADIDGQLANIYPENIEAMYEYYEKTGKPLIFITHRWDIENTKKLFSRLFPFKTYKIRYVNPRDSKGLVAKEEKIDLFIDDDVGVAMKMQRDGVTVVLYEQPWNLYCPVTKIKSLKEII